MKIKTFGEDIKHLSVFFYVQQNINICLMGNSYFMSEYRIL